MSLRAFGKSQSIMIKFFRRIRQKLLSENRFSKYLIYAIGEIILVVIGILIALQINNWNDNRIKNNQVKTYALKLISDLKQDIQAVKYIKWQAETAYLRLDSLINYTRNQSIEDCNNLDLYVLAYNARYKPYSWNRASYEELKSTGILSYFDNDSLVNLLVKYDAFSKHMDADYQEDFELIMETNKLIQKVVNMNYIGNPLAIRITTTAYFDQVEIIDYQNADFYLALKQQAVDFIDRDQKKLDESINSYVNLKFNYSIRYDLELPRLISDAKAIIKLLEDHYLAEDIKNGTLKRYQSKTLSELVIDGKTIDEIMDIIKSEDLKDQVYDTSQNGLNRFAYNLLKQHKTAEALQIFKLNTELHYNWHSMDGYAEGLLHVGDTLNAIKAYQTSLQLNPNNTNAVKMIEQIN